MDYYHFLKDRFSNGVFNGDKTRPSAVKHAYADMSRRATGHTAALRDNCIAWLSEEVFRNLPEIRSQDEFDKWHEDTCAALKERHGTFGKIGRSQKVINMAFKYLSCVDDTYDPILPYCHMTLDGYTLKWYKTINKNWKAIEWSKIDSYDEYMAIQKTIRQHLKNGAIYSIAIEDKKTREIELPKLPFEAEFIIWEGEIINARYNNLIKELRNYASSGTEKDHWLIGDLFDQFLSDFR